VKIQDAKNRPFGTIAQLCRAVSLQLRHVPTIGKKLVKHRYLPTCPHTMVNFDLLTAEICWRVWGTPANFNSFCILAALLHGTLVVGVSQTAALNRRRHLYSLFTAPRLFVCHFVKYLKRGQKAKVLDVIRFLFNDNHRRENE